MRSRYRTVQKLRAAAHRVAVLGVSRSGYYGCCGRAPSRRQSEDARITGELKAAFEQSRRTYGWPRLTRALRARPRRRFVPPTTQSRHDSPMALNRLAERATPPTRPDEVCGGRHDLYRDR